MRWLRIAISSIVSVLTLLCAYPAFAESSSGWSVLLDEHARLQLSDVRSDRYQNQFSPLELSQLVPSGPNAAQWLHYHLPPAAHEQVLRIYAPDLADLDFYVLDGDTVIRQQRNDAGRPGGEPSFANTDILLPVPVSQKPLDLYLRLASEHQLRPSVSMMPAVSAAADQRQTLIMGLLFGCLGMLVIHNLARYTYSRSSSSLWLAGAETLLTLSAAILLNLSGPCSTPGIRCAPPAASSP